MTTSTAWAWGADLDAIHEVRDVETSRGDMITCWPVEYGVELAGGWRIADRAAIVPALFDTAEQAAAALREVLRRRIRDAKKDLVRFERALAKVEALPKQAR